MAPHTHKVAGVVHVCYHSCRGFITDWKFWLGVTGSFPIEHFLWEKVPPFTYLTGWLGL